ncbi:craniofacial development protein 2 [Octopus bimaculoides]|nr:craniofacial development protein 2 [Octopus bimaculoides]|eukprot:XP_014788015.1 PREDICTED: craniofacial development protein 2-like [Octopus bimaculoides]
MQQRHINSRITVIQAYAPIEDTEEADKDAFYDQLQDALDDAPHHDLVLLTGDFNAKSTRNQQGYEHVISPNGTATDTSSNSERLVSFCSTNGLVIGNTYFEQKWIYKEMWRSPDGRTFNEVDYVCTSKRWKSTLLDMRTCRGADVGSDHYLLLMKYRLRLRCLPLVQSRPRPFAVEKFKDRRTVDQFQ